MPPSTILSHREIQQLLTDHYIDEHCESYFPPELSRLCFQFVNEYEVLQIPAKYTKALSLCDITTLRKLPPLSIPYQVSNDLLFELDTSNYDMNSFCIRLKSVKLPSNADYVRLLVRVYCTQTNYQYIECHKFVIGGRSIHYLFEVYPYECEHIEGTPLDCVLQIDLIEMKYQNEERAIGFLSKQIRMQRQCNFDFVLSKSTLEKHKFRRYINRFYSSPVDNVWCISSHSGRMTAFLEFNDIFDILCLRLKLLILPFGVSSIKIKHSIKCTNDDHVKHRRGIRMFEYDSMLFEFYDSKEFYHYKDFYIPLEMIKKSLTFRVWIELIQVKDVDGNVVPKANWCKYGIT